MTVGIIANKKKSEFYLEAYMVFLKKEPPKKYRKSTNDMTPDEFIWLQNFIGTHQRVVTWSTNISIMECVDRLVQEAINNQNIGFTK
jgi:uncharacterized protein YvpB